MRVSFALLSLPIRSQNKFQFNNAKTMAIFFKPAPNDRVKSAVAEALATKPASAGEHQKMAAHLLMKAQPEFNSMIMEALAKEPPPPGEHVKLTNEMADSLPFGGSQKIAWERVIAAAVLLGLIFFAGIYTSHDDKMQEWSKPLLNTFTLVLGALGGLITGEAAAKK